FRERDGDGVRLFARSAARRNDAQAACARRPQRHHLLEQRLDLLLPATEKRLRHGDELGERGRFARPVLARREPRDVGVEPVEPELLRAATDGMAELLELIALEREADLFAHGSAQALDFGALGTDGHGLASLAVALGST